MRTRFCVVGLIHNSNNQYLICKMPENRGMYPGQWALPGGGIEEGERMEEALKREMREEVGLEVTDLEPFLFGDDTRMKLKDGTQEEIYMIYLLYQVKAVGEQVVIGEEFENYKWVGVDEAFKYDLNDPTVKTFEKLVK